MSIINNEAWDKLKKQIEYHYEQDNNITDININYQLKVPKIGTKNILKLSVTVGD